MLLIVAIVVGSFGAMGGVLPRTELRCSKARLTLTLTRDDADLASEKVVSRLRQLGRLIGREPEVQIKD